MKISLNLDKNQFDLLNYLAPLVNCKQRKDKKKAAKNKKLTKVPPSFNEKNNFFFVASFFSHI